MSTVQLAVDVVYVSTVQLAVDVVYVSTVQLAGSYNFQRRVADVQKKTTKLIQI